jgi:hypothetical protein
MSSGETLCRPAGSFMAQESTPVVEFAAMNGSDGSVVRVEEDGR